MIVFWDTATGRCLGSRDLADGCGIAPAGDGGFLATSGRGAIVEAGPVGARTIQAEQPSVLGWDNHLRRFE